MVVGVDGLSEIGEVVQHLARNAVLILTRHKPYVGIDIVTIHLQHVGEAHVQDLLVTCTQTKTVTHNIAKVSLSHCVNIIQSFR